MDGITLGQKRRRSVSAASPAPATASAAAKPGSGVQSNWEKLKLKKAQHMEGHRQPERSDKIHSSRSSSCGTSAISSASASAPKCQAAAATSATGRSSDRKAQALTTIMGPFTERSLNTEESKYIAVDCEMVGVGADGVRSALAQVVCVDWLGRVVYCKYVKPTETVTDYRTHVSGIRPEHVRNALDFKTVQKEVADLVKGKVMVGHGLINDLKALLLSHSWQHIRDTARYRPFVRKTRTGHVKPRRLKHLVEQHLGIQIQTGEHEPAEDARAALALYKLYRIQWERDILAQIAGKQQSRGRPSLAERGDASDPTVGANSRPGKERRNKKAKR